MKFQIIFYPLGLKEMNIPNWIHHSKKDKKRTLKPQALRQRKEALRNLKKKLSITRTSLS
jgi:hypothetical protein